VPKHHCTHTTARTPHTARNTEPTTPHTTHRKSHPITHAASAPHSRQSCQAAQRRRDAAGELVTVQHQTPAGRTNSHRVTPWQPTPPPKPTSRPRCISGHRIASINHVKASKHTACYRSCTTPCASDFEATHTVLQPRRVDTQPRMPSRHTQQRLHRRRVEGQQRDDSDCARPELDALQTKSLLTELRINAAASRLLSPTAVARVYSTAPQARRRILQRTRAHTDYHPQMHLDTQQHTLPRRAARTNTHKHETHSDHWHPETYTDTNRQVRYIHAHTTQEQLRTHSLQVNLLASTEASTIIRNCTPVRNHNQWCPPAVTPRAPTLCHKVAVANSGCAATVVGQL
jgi:hypothetical protein